MTHEPTENPNDWLPLFRAFSEAFEWSLDLAGGLAAAYPAELACIERVRTFARRRLAGDPAHLRIDDLLFTLGLLAGALERDVRPALTPRVVETLLAMGSGPIASAPIVAANDATVASPAPPRVKRTLRVSHRKPAKRRVTFSARATAVAKPRSAIEIARERWAA